MIELKKNIRFRPAFDKGDQGGIHGVDLEFALIGPAGAVTLMIYTGWHLPEVRETLRGKGYHPEVLPADFGYHSRNKIHSGIKCPCCHLLKGAACYYDGSGLRANEVFDLFVREGEEALWTYMTDEYFRLWPHNAPAASEQSKQ